MKKLSLFAWMMIASFVFVGCSSDDDNGKKNGEKETFVVSFKGALEDGKDHFIGKDGVPEGSYLRKDFKDPDDKVTFTHYYGDWGFGGGFTYTNQSDKTTPGYNNLSAITGNGKNSNTYMTIYSNEFTPALLTIVDDEIYQFQSISVTNTTYAYLAIADGNDGSGVARKFTDGDWFKLTITIGNPKINGVYSEEIYLADFRDGKSDIVNEWVEIDLSKYTLGTSLSFSLSSSDVGDFGINTPSYFCIDEITLVEK